MHTTHFIRPLLSSYLSLKSGSRSEIENERGTRWPQSYPPFQANIIFISPDFSDLEATVTWLREHPKAAEGIADRQRKFVEKGYLSEAAEVCYWRSLVKGWASIVKADEKAWGSWDDESENVRGVRWEEFSLTGKGPRE